MKYILIFFFPFFVLGQSQNKDSSHLSRHSFEIQYSSLNLSLFGGNLLVGNYFYKLNERHRIGISTGIFYHQNKDSKDRIMKYSYFPLMFA